MIDERTLTDPSRCPACGAALTSGQTCPECGVTLRGSTAAELWQVSVQAAAVLDRRRMLLQRLRAESRSPSYDPAPAAPRPLSVPVAPPVRSAEWSRRRVQNLLLALGVLLLAVAAVIFLVVSWDVLGVGGRAAVMAGCTAVAAAGAVVASRRGLTATAEAVALLTVGLGLLDAFGARSAGLAGLDSVAGRPYWAGALAVIALTTAAGAVGLPLRSLRLSTAILGQLSGPLLAVHWADASEHPVAVFAAVLTVQTVLAVALVVAWPFGPVAADARVVVVAGAVIAWSVAGVTAAAAAFGEDGSLVLAALLLLVLAAAAVGAALGADTGPRSGVLTLTDLLVGAAALVTVAAVWAPAAELTESSWLAPTLSGLGVAMLGLMLLVPALWRPAPSMVFLVAAVSPGVAAAEPVQAALLGRLSWLGAAWTEPASARARDVVGAAGLAWPGEVSTPLLVLSVALALAVVGAAVAVLQPALKAVVPLLALAALTAPAAFDLTFRAGLGLDLAVALLLLGAGPSLVRAGRPALGWGAVGSGAVVLGLGVAWSFASAATTLTVLPVATALLVLAAWGVRSLPGATALPMTFGTAAVLSLIGEAAAVARYDGASWPAVWTLALSLGVGAALAAAVVSRGDRRADFAAVATAALAADSAAITVWTGGSVPGAGLAVTVTGALVVVAACQPFVRWPTLERMTDRQTWVGAGAVALGLLVSSGDADVVWLALLAAGVAAGAAAVRGIERRWLGWLSGALLAASTWVRLALSDVDAPEPYTVPSGLALLVLGGMRRRRDPSYRSWPAYAPGLVLVLVPSLVRAVNDPGMLRPLLLGVAALAVLGVGVARRLQAPLVVGGSVLAVDALVQLSPFLADLYAAVPRWTVIGTVGLLLLALGATYERRVRDVRLMHERLSALG